MPTQGPALTRILARNLIAATVTPAFVCDDRGAVTFFNEACARLIGRRFEESGRQTPDERTENRPVNEHGEPVSGERLPLTVALREHRPAVGRFLIKTDAGTTQEVEALAVPLDEAEESAGAFVTFVAVGAPARAATA